MGITNSHTHTHARTHAHTHAHTHTHTHTHTHAHTHTHTHTHTLTHSHTHTHTHTLYIHHSQGDPLKYTIISIHNCTCDGTCTCTQLYKWSNIVLYSITLLSL